MAMNDIFTPMIRELEELARTHPDPRVRAEVMHLIDLMTQTCDQNLLEVMHQFYHLREKLREECEINRLLGDVEVVKTTDALPFDFSGTFNELPAYTKPNPPNQFQDVLDEIEVDELVLAHKRWRVVIGDA